MKKIWARRASVAARPHPGAKMALNQVYIHNDVKLWDTWGPLTFVRYDTRITVFKRRKRRNGPDGDTLMKKQTMIPKKTLMNETCL